MLNKKCLFGGGLYLVNTAVIVISTSNVAAAEASIKPLINPLNQIFWRIYANNLIKFSKTGKEHPWIQNPYYYDSIVKVIGKAIGDCVANENEFKGKTAYDIITFQDTNPYAYTRANWNAVILYNYVNSIIKSPRKRQDLVTIESCVSMIKQYYSKQYKNINLTNLQLAQNDMNKYNKALILENVLALIQSHVCSNKYATSLEQILSDSLIIDNKTESGIKFHYEEEFNKIVYQTHVLSYSLKKQNNMENLKMAQIRYQPVFQYEGSKLFVPMFRKYKLFIDKDNDIIRDEYVSDCDSMSLKTTAPEVLKLLDGLVEFPEG